MTITGNEISGLSYTNTVADLMGKITSKYNIKITDKNGNELTENQLVGTGSKIIFMDENNDIIRELKEAIAYNDILYANNLKSWTKSAFKK